MVKRVECDPKYGHGRVIAWALWCSSAHEKKDRQPAVALNNKKLDDPEAVPTYQVAAERLIAKIEEKHGGCIAAAEAAKAGAAIHSAQAGPSETAQIDAFAAMRRVQAARSWKLHEGKRFYDGESARKVKRWFHRCDDDASGCKFIEWDPSKEAAVGAPPAAMLINSSKLRAVFGSEQFKQVSSLPLNLAPRTRGAAVREIDVEAVGGETWFMLHEDTDSMTRDRCIAVGSVLQ